MRKYFNLAFPDLFTEPMVSQQDEAIVTNANQGENGRKKDDEYYSAEMMKSLLRAREMLKPEGISVIVFADSTTNAWESILQAILKSGFTVTASWAIDTELQSRTQAKDSASLQSSVHLVCRPRENPDGFCFRN